MTLFSKKENKQTRLDSIIQNLNLSGDKKEVLQLVWLDYFNFTDKRAVKNYKGFDFLQLVIIVTGVMIPVLEGTGLDDMVKHAIGVKVNIGLISILGLIVAISAGVNRHYTFEEKWRHYRQNAELMRNEGEDFLALSNRYSRYADHEAAFGNFIAFVTNFKRSELQAYMAGPDDNQESTPGSEPNK